MKSKKGMVLERAKLGVVKRAGEVGVRVGEEMEREWTWTSCRVLAASVVLGATARRVWGAWGRAATTGVTVVVVVVIVIGALLLVLERRPVLLLLLRCRVYKHRLPPHIPIAPITLIVSTTAHPITHPMTTTRLPRPRHIALMHVTNIMRVLE